MNLFVVHGEGRQGPNHRKGVQRINELRYSVQW
jgi:hypothetical protein